MPQAKLNKILILAFSLFFFMNKYVALYPRQSLYRATYTLAVGVQLQFIRTVSSFYASTLPNKEKRVQPAFLIQAAPIRSR